MLIIFDVDGTLVGGERTDWRCFDDAFHHVAGFPFGDSFWIDLPEVTAKAIVHQALPDHSESDRAGIEGGVRERYLALLQGAHSDDRSAFPPMPGALETLEFLDQQEGIDVAIATGDWHGSIRFKLEAAGIDASRIPMATSSDRYARSEIIRLAADRAGRPLTEALYVGDGIWDFQATQKLGIPFLGVGRRHQEFREAGACHALESLASHRFIPWFTTFASL